MLFFFIFFWGGGTSFCRGAMKEIRFRSNDLFPFKLQHPIKKLHLSQEIQRTTQKSKGFEENKFIVDSTNKIPSWKKQISTISMAWMTSFKIKSTRYPWTPKPWNMKVCFTHNIWVKSPLKMTDQRGFPWYMGVSKNNATPKSSHV